VYIVIFAMIPATLKTLQEAVFVAHERVEFVTYSTLIAAALVVGATFYLLRHGYGIVSLVVVYAAVQYVISLCHFFLLNRYLVNLEWSFDYRFALRMVKEIKVLAGSSLLAAVSSRPEVMLLSFLKSDAQIGFYSAALRIVDLWQVIPETYMRNVFPLLSRSEHTQDKRTSGMLLSRSLKYLLAISLPVTVGIFVAARPITALLYGPGFDQTVTALRIVTWYIPLTFLHEVLWRLLVARDQQHLLVRAQAITIVVRLAMGYLLIGWLASLGAAISATLIFLEHNLLLWFFVRRDGTRLGLFRLAWRLSLAALVMGLLATLLVSRSELWVVVLAAAFCYGTMVILLEALSSNELALFRTRWQVPSAD
jgi:O-antigen/teichoic acid export membrane protein